jgi:hypothetical protein
MTNEFEARYMQLGALLSQAPKLDGTDPIGPEALAWLGRMAVLVEAVAPFGDLDSISFRVAVDSLNGVTRSSNAHKIIAIAHRALARAEAKAPAAAKGAYVGVGAQFSALQAVANLLGSARAELVIVDPYMGPAVLSDFAVTAPEGVIIRLLADSFYTKLDVLTPAIERWRAQYGGDRPLEVRLSPPRQLHDRLILIDSSQAWSLTQSLKDFAGRSPASIVRLPQEVAEPKLAFYADLWNTAVAI